MNNGKSLNCPRCDDEGGYICEEGICKCLACGLEMEEGKIFEGTKFLNIKKKTEEIEEVAPEPPEIKYYTEEKILEAFDTTFNDVWQEGDVSYYQTTSRETNRKKFLQRLRK